ncbi:MAG: hypothetical protein EOO04_08315 [Chitinophagaceae bacterium]|nr:MAG: hypothetical protein EOO04_08315 [Chitinophagaceae bacterium]
MSILRKTLLSSVVTIMLATNSHAQTLFTYGNTPVSKQEFLNAYNKNNAGETATAEGYKNYLELYTRFKLKVKAARDLKLDTLASQKAELQAFKLQVAENYMNDEATINLLVNEAFERGKKEVHLAHIFLPLEEDADAGEVKIASEKMQSAYERLVKGESFETVAVAYSADPAAPVNKGNLGYITAFTLNYELENIAYKTKVNQFSKPYRSEIGLHIFKNLGERPSSGRIRAAQILLAFAPDMNDTQKQQLAVRADSIYQVTIAGGDFKTLAAQFSDDNLTYQTGGEMMEFGVGKFEPAFENAAFALQNDNDISRPIRTSFGYHIIKRLQRKPAITSLDDQRERDALRQSVFQSDRMQIARKAQLARIKSQTNYRKALYSEKQFLRASDSLLRGSAIPAITGITPATILFTVGNKKVTMKHWREYLTPFQNTRAGNTIPALFDEFTDQLIVDYYREHLESYNKEFAGQLNEFREGNLLFEIMQRNIWDKAAADSAGLQTYFNRNKTKYKWEASADAIIFTFASASLADSMRPIIQANWKNWSALTDSSEGLMQADSARFELSQLPVPDRTNFQEKLLTANTKNENDLSVSYSYIIRMYPADEQRDFAAARGFVINDYQAYLEEQWIQSLKKKYPLRINESVFKTLQD